MKLSARWKMYQENDIYLNGWNGRWISARLDRACALTKIFALKRIYLPYVELVVTTKCSLKCRNCSNLMQLYAKPYDVELRVIKESIKNLLDAVERIGMFRVLGGEPFLYPDLAEVLDILISSKKIKVIGIPTNGTVFPKMEVITMLKNPKVRLDISDYGVRDISNFLKMCQEKEIHHSVTLDKVWLDIGDMECRERCERELDVQYKRCNLQCRNILNGKMFRCPRASHGDDLEIIKTPQNEFVNLVDIKSIKELRKSIAEVYYRNEYVEACNYCDIGTDVLKKIPAGIQQ